MKSARLNLVGVYSITLRWSLTARLSQHHLMGDAADSSIMQRRNYPEAALFAAWSWGAVL